MCQDCPEIVVYLIAMAVTLVNDIGSIETAHQRIFAQLAGIGAETQCAADVTIRVLIGHESDDRMCGLRVKLYAVGVMYVTYVLCIPPTLLF